MSENHPTRRDVLMSRAALPLLASTLKAEAGASVCFMSAVEIAGLGSPSLGITFRQYDQSQKTWVIEHLNVSESFLRRQVGTGSVAVSGRPVTVTSGSAGVVVREHYVAPDADNWVYRLDSSKDGGRMGRRVHRVHFPPIEVDLDDHDETPMNAPFMTADDLLAGVVGAVWGPRDAASSSASTTF